jgi:hypothetical protein
MEIRIDMANQAANPIERMLGPHRSTQLKNSNHHHERRLREQEASSLTIFPQNQRHELNHHRIGASPREADPSMPYHQSQIQQQVTNPNLPNHEINKIKIDENFASMCATKSKKSLVPGIFRQEERRGFGIREKKCPAL